jgi:hypothetical protein
VSVDLALYLLAVARLQPGKDVPAAKKNCWRRRFLCGLCRIVGKHVISSARFLFVLYLRTL